MEASELRCGNKLVRPNGNIATVTWGVIKDVDNGDKTYQPIPLNEEWLIKFRFNKHSSPGHNDFYARNWGKNGIEIVKWSPFYNKFCYELGQFNYKVLDYVHQLQNLSYYLTNQELTVKQK